MIGDGLQSKVYLGSKNIKHNNQDSIEKNDLTTSSNAQTHFESDDIFAVKVFDKEELKHLGTKEFDILKQLGNHQNIIKAFNHGSDQILKDISSDNSSQIISPRQTTSGSFDYMTMEYCPNGDMFDFVKKTGKLNKNLAKHFFMQLLEGVEFLHKDNGIAHLDLKLENILIGKEYKLKLCDFGFSEKIENKVFKNKGTDGYKAPEIYQCNYNWGYDADKSDIFALGVILFILEFGVPPFCMATKEDPYYRYFYRGPNYLKFFFRMHPATKEAYQNGSIDLELSELLLALLDSNPDMRPKNIEEIRNFSYLQKQDMSEGEVQEEIKRRLFEMQNMKKNL